MNPATRLEFRYDQKFYVDQSENNTREVNPSMRLRPVTTGSTTLTNERSRSGSKTQPTAQYKEGNALHTFSPSASEVNISPLLTKLTSSRLLIGLSKFSSTHRTHCQAHHYTRAHALVVEILQETHIVVPCALVVSLVHCSLAVVFGLPSVSLPQLTGQQPNGHVNSSITNDNWDELRLNETEAALFGNLITRCRGSSFPFMG
ncbi:hypothetical protein FHG87_024410 [Trinorchestia longiramus]|nr:hypothetical protein FHG87_024410 [Trinorchestia longiramus]